VYYTDASGFDFTKVTAYGGTGYQGASGGTAIGGAGTIYLKANGALAAKSEDLLQDLTQYDGLYAGAVQPRASARPALWAASQAGCFRPRVRADEFSSSSEAAFFPRLYTHRSFVAAAPERKRVARRRGHSILLAGAASRNHPFPLNFC
jgi:hypothetical protein